MPKAALYGAAIVFTALAVVSAALYVFDTDIVVGNALFRPLNILAGAILFTLLAGWMIVASLEYRSDE